MIDQEEQNVSRQTAVKRIRPAMRRAATAAAALGAALAPTASAWGQAAPQPNVTNTPAPWVGFAIMFVLMAVVLAISLMPSKRSHQD